MCRCTPELRTPFCGKPGCQWPHRKRPTGARPHATKELIPEPLARHLYNSVVDWFWDRRESFGVNWDRYDNPIDDQHAVVSVASVLSGFLTGIPDPGVKKTLIDGIHTALKKEHGIP